MATKYQYYSAGDDWRSIISSTSQLLGQTFTIVTTHLINYAKIKLYRIGTPGTLTLQVRTTSGGEPTSTVLTSGTTDGDTLTEDTGGEWRQINFSSAVELASGTKYALVLSAPSADGSNKVAWRYDSGDASYTGGQNCNSTDGGSTWTITDEFYGDGTTYDNMFEEWGVAFAPPVDIVTYKRLVAAAKNTFFYEDI